MSTHRLFEVADGLGVELAVGADLAGVHRGIGVVGGFPEPLLLDVAGGDHASADGGGGLAGRGSGGQLTEIDERHFHMQVDPVQQGSRDPLAVVLDLAR